MRSATALWSIGLHRDHRAVLDAIANRDVRDAAHSMALHVDRDLGLRTDMLDFAPQTERATTLIDAGYDSEEIAAG
jgi:DNA-binding GntR family transcriptional regulator